ncbi:riboflavin synthase [Pseudoxanthobacter sp.]|uniref:riboflavin synthase n=1 Tax=Pseudoxanthobacter sp. TaxID=1925742 RepID=UPI002FE3200C
MFTGIITDVGTLAAVETRGAVRRLVIDSRYDAQTIEIGASIACNGVCLTVVECAPKPAGGSHIAFDAAPETLAVTTVAGWAAGERLNLERALKIGDELGGHIVAGHVDGLAELIAREEIGETTRLTFRAPAALARFIAPKGSVALDGTSLTVNTVAGNDFSVLLIPHTLAVTTWGGRKAGDPVNLEVDLMARYVARLQEARPE